MNGDLQEFLARHSPSCARLTDWGNLPLRVEAYVTTAPAPLDYVTSVRALVTKGDMVLVLHNGDERHVLPGGRRELGESIEQTLHREVLEETGVLIGEPALLGFIHYQHLGPRPDGHPYPYPDFLQLVYHADAIGCRPEARVHDPYVTASDFCPLSMVCELPVFEEEAIYLRAIGS